MANSPEVIESPERLRASAEERLRDQGEPADLAGRSQEQTQALVHELRVHQIELEMQNEHLRATQAELEKARERYVELYDNAPVGYLSISRQGMILAANLTSANMLGVERSRLQTLPFSRFVPKDDQDSFYLCLRKAFAADFNQVCEVRVCPSGGEMYYGRLEILRATEEGTPVCHLTLSNIDEQKRAEEALRENERRRLQYENEERLRLAFDAGALGAWDQDLRTGRIVCSDRACAMLGFTPGAPLTWPAFLERIHTEDRPDFLRTVEQCACAEGACRLETVFRVVRPGGEVRWLQFAARCFFETGPPRKVVRRAGVLADITQRKQAEEVLQSQARKLEELVRERTARLREAMEELEHFSYSMVHDMRAPLRSMTMFASLLLQDYADRLPPAAQDNLTRIFNSAKRMDSLVTDALHYATVLRAELPLQPIDAGQLLRGLVESYPEFQPANAEIRLEEPLPAVLGNEAFLTQCFSNLLGNAVKFVPPGVKPRIRVWAETVPPPATDPAPNGAGPSADGSRVRIWFEDNGVGVPVTGRLRIFDMFQRLHVGYPGTGIGLAIVRKAAERMGGKAGVQSEPGHGSQFWVELRAAPPLPLS